jgi:cyclopropane-fatty-acyl-phospholipid synthase
VTKRWIDRRAKRMFLGLAESIRYGSIDIVCPDRTYTFEGAGAGAMAMMVVHDERAFGRTLLHGDRGLGESYMDGDWSSPDLVALLRVALRNSHAFNQLNSTWSWVARQTGRLRHALRANTPTGGRANIARHYDLGNDLFALFLDEQLLYSSAWYAEPGLSLEEAQLAKIDRLCDKLQLHPDDHLLEIGTGWGALAARAATRYGCRVTTTTISREQHDYAAARFRRDGLTDRVTLLFEDYRDLRGRFTHIVSVEMFEAVGLRHYDDFFSACDRLLAPDGAVLLQTITISEQDFQRTYGRAEDWVQGHIFPGSELACLSEVLRSLGRVTSLRPFHLEDIGLDYARTIHDWRERFQGHLDEVRDLGYDERFIRMWDLYLAFCEAAFAERHISDVHLLLTRAYHDGRYYGEASTGVGVVADADRRFTGAAIPRPNGQRRGDAAR